MGWEYRNGKPYFYKKERVHGRVKSTYLGRGALALFEEQIAELQQERIEQERAERQQERAAFAALAAPLPGVLETVAAARVAAQQALEAAGYHQHARGQWRKKRGTNNKAPSGRTAARNTRTDRRA